MSVTSLDRLGGIDLDSLIQYNQENNTNYDDQVLKNLHLFIIIAKKYKKFVILFRSYC